jgi:hypothetical protein
VTSGEAVVRHIDHAEATRGLHWKLAEVMAEVKAIEKKGQFKVGNDVRYRYVQAADLYEMVREKLASRYVTLVPSFKGFGDTWTIGSTRAITVIVRLRFTDAETGETDDAEWPGTAMDSGDKAVYKALTGAAKSFLLTMFLVPSDTDPDDDGQGKAKARASSGKLTKRDSDTLAAIVKAYLDGGDEVVLRLRLKQLGAGDVTDITAAALRLSKDKAEQLFRWLDDELVERQGAKP